MAPMISSLTCTRCDTYQRLIQDLARRLHVIRTDLGEERKISEQLKILNDHLIHAPADLFRSIDSSLSAGSTVFTPLAATPDLDDTDFERIETYLSAPTSPDSVSSRSSVCRSGGSPEAIVGKAKPGRRALDEFAGFGVRPTIKFSYDEDDEADPMAVGSKPELHSIANIHATHQHISDTTNAPAVDLIKYNAAVNMGIIYVPDEGESDVYRTVMITNVPVTEALTGLLAQIESGLIISASLCDTVKLVGSNTARVVFLHESSARHCVAHIARYPLRRQGSKSAGPGSGDGYDCGSDERSMRAILLGVPTSPIDSFLLDSIQHGSRSRILRLERCLSGIPDRDLKTLFSPSGTRNNRVLTIRRDKDQREVNTTLVSPGYEYGISAQSSGSELVNERGLDMHAQHVNGDPQWAKYENLTIEFGSVIEAIMAFEKVTIGYRVHPDFRQCTARFLRDPCERARSLNGLGDRDVVGHEDGSVDETRGDRDSAGHAGVGDGDGSRVIGVVPQSDGDGPGIAWRHPCPLSSLDERMLPQGHFRADSGCAGVQDSEELLIEL